MMKKEKIVIDSSLLKAINQCVLGMTTRETTTEYAPDDNGELKIVKQKVSEKTIPPNVDIIKLVYQSSMDKKIDYEKMTDEELEQEKQRLLKELKEKENDSGKVKNKSQV